jgi:hypothetical protein
MTWGEATSSKPHLVQNICSVGLNSFNACAREKRPGAHSLESLVDATDGTGCEFYFSKPLIQSHVIAPFLEQTLVVLVISCGGSSLSNRPEEGGDGRTERFYRL